LGQVLSRDLPGLPHRLQEEHNRWSRTLEPAVSGEAGGVAGPSGPPELLD
jgi:hypothetical protein